MSISIRARVVFPVDGPPIERGVVTIDDGRIVEVRTHARQANVIDLASVALLPGLVNAHTHLEFSHLRQPLGEPGMVLPNWIRLVIAERGRSGADARIAIGTGLAESANCGVTTLGDIASGRTDNPVRRSKPDGQDCPSYGGSDRIVFFEVIGFSRARADSACVALVERLNAAASDPASRVGISPHAPYTVSPALLRRLIAESRQHGLPVAMHLAESREELAFLKTGAGPLQELLDERSMWDAEAVPHGSRPLDYLRLLADAPRALVIHGNYLNDEELAFLAGQRERMSLVYCPRTHTYFQHEPYPLVAAMMAGVRVALGTDSRASNPDLDLLAEIRFVARAYPTIDPHDVLQMGTLTGAEALGREDEVGSLTPGKLANMVAVPLPEDVRGTPNDLLAAIFANGWPVSSVWLRGNEQ